MSTTLCVRDLSKRTPPSYRTLHSPPMRRLELHAARAHATRSECRAFMGPGPAPSSPAGMGLRRVSDSTTSVEVIEMPTSAAPRTYSTQGELIFN